MKKITMHPVGDGSGYASFNYAILMGGKDPQHRHQEGNILLTIVAINPYWLHSKDTALWHP